jgi:hypothetical protein
LKNQITTGNDQHEGLLFLVDHVIQTGKNLLGGEWSESEPRTAGLEGRNDFAQVVADYAKSDVFGVLLDD